MTRIEDHLVKAIIDIAIFLEFTEAGLLNEDAAVGAMEQLSGELQQMDEYDQKELSQKIIALAPAHGSPHKEFIETLPEALGLV
jgi:hypothetical protein